MHHSPAVNLIPQSKEIIVEPVTRDAAEGDIYWLNDLRL